MAAFECQRVNPIISKQQTQPYRSGTPARALGEGGGGGGGRGRMVIAVVQVSNRDVSSGLL